MQRAMHLQDSLSHTRTTSQAHRCELLFGLEESGETSVNQYADNIFYMLSL